MKKANIRSICILLLCIILVLVFLFSIRFTLYSYFGTRNLFKKILYAIESRDEKSLLNLFSKQALDEANDIEKGIEYIFGEDFKHCENYYGLGFHDELFVDNVKYAYFNQSFKVFFNGIEYSAFIQYRTGPTNYEKGLYSLGITKTEGRKNTQYRSRNPGIYYPGWDK